jgi:hypothetical protein
VYYRISSARIRNLAERILLFSFNYPITNPQAQGLRAKGQGLVLPNKYAACNTVAHRGTISAG